MAEINEFIDPRAEKQVQEYLASLTKIAEKYNVIFQAATQLDTAITKVSKTTADASKKQSQADQAGAEAIRIAKEQKSAMEALDRQRQKALQDITKQEAKERSLQAAISMQVKTLKDAENQNRALNEAKKRVDITTKQGIQTVAEYNRKIDQNNKLIKQNASEEGKRKLGIGQYQQALMKTIAVIGIAIGAFKSFMGFFGDAIAAWDRGARVTAQLNAVIRSTGGVAGRTADQIKSQAKALNELTGISSKQITAGQSMLLTFVNVRGEIYDRAVPAMLDMATSMAAVNGEEVNLKETSIRLGKALNDPIAGMTALKRVGVTFTEQQKAQIKTLVQSGDLIGAQTIILTELQTEFGGSAKAAGEVGTTSFRKLSQAWKAFQAPAGGFLVGILAPISDFARNVLKAVTPVEILSDKMEDQKTKVNALVIALSDSNIKDSVRLKLYEQLKDIAPDVVKGINAENISVIALNKNLAEYNKQQLNKILLQRGQEDIDKALKKEADAFENLMGATERAGKAAEKTYGDIVSGSDKLKKAIAITIKADFLAGRIDLEQYVKSLGKLSETLGSFSATTTGGAVVTSSSELQKSLNNLTGTQARYDEQSKVSISLTEKRIDLADKLGVSLAEPAIAAPTSGLVDEDAAEKAADAAKKAADERNKAVLAGFKTELEYFDATMLTKATKETELTDEIIKAEEERLNQRAAIQQKSLDFELEKGIKNAKEVEVGKLEITNDIEQQIADLKLEKIKQGIENEKELEKERKAFIEASIAEQNSIVARLADARVNIVKNEYAAGILSSQEYNDAVKSIEFETQAELLENTIMRLDQELLNTEMSDSKRLELRTELADAEQELDNVVTDNALANEEKRREALQNTLNTIQSVGSQVSEIVQGLFENESIKLEQEKERQLAAVGDNAAAKEQIEKQFAVKQAEVKRKQAIAEKASAIFSIAIETAKNIVSAFPNVFLMALAGALGLAQGAIVLAKPLPQIPAFAKGTKSAPRGPAFIAEAGREILYKNGKASVIDKPSFINLAGGEQILTNRETERIMQAANKGRVGFDSEFLRDSISSGNERIVAAINGKRELHISSSGSKITEREGNYYKTYFNRRVRWAGSKT